MSKPRIHPKAYLTIIRNVKAGVLSRTCILFALEDGKKTTQQVSKQADLSYDCVAHHLKTMRREGIVERSSGKRPYVWKLTPFGQQRLAY